MNTVYSDIWDLRNSFSYLKKVFTQDSKSLEHYDSDGLRLNSKQVRAGTVLIAYLVNLDAYSAGVAYHNHEGPGIYWIYDEHEPQLFPGTRERALADAARLRVMVEFLKNEDAVVEELETVASVVDAYGYDVLRLLAEQFTENDTE